MYYTVSWMCLMANIHNHYGCMLKSLNVWLKFSIILDFSNIILHYSITLKFCLFIDNK
ncbi:MAG: hypothetical protein RLZZ306_2857 [Bacteroidota bacterium]|jgi:hypothetical protein